MIGVVSSELGRYESFRRSMLGLEAPPGTRLATASSLTLPRNRNALVRELLATEGEWLFALDDDLVLSRTCLTRLRRVMDEGGWDIVSAFTLRRQPPFDALVYLADPTTPPYCDPWIPDGRTGVMEIAAGGLGGVLIHRRVFERLEPPYFRVGQIDPEHYQEDVEFFRRARLAGCRACVDLDTPLGHTTPMTVWPARDPDGRAMVALAGAGGEILPFDPDAYRSDPRVNPALIGL